MGRSKHSGEDKQPEDPSNGDKRTNKKPFLSTADSIKSGPAYRECIAMGGKWVKGKCQ